jgi:transcriptional regulator with XRE-family HTH domain
MATRKKIDLRKLPVGEQIRLLREARRLTIADLCIGELSNAAISRIETGARYPALHSVETLAGLLDCTFTVTGSLTYIEELEEALKEAREAAKTG